MCFLGGRGKVTFFAKGSWFRSPDGLNLLGSQRITGMTGLRVLFGGGCKPSDYLGFGATDSGRTD